MSYTESTIKEQPYLIRRCLSYTEHSDLNATAMSIDWSGENVLLAGRRYYALQSVKQHDDHDSLRKFTRNSKHEVSSAEFAICQHTQEYCAISTNQSIDVVTWRYGDPTLIHSLRAHTRDITDIDWHSKSPHLLASCSIDSFTHLWDLRDPRKPILSLSAVCMSGATQVGFNRVSGNLIASAHDGDLRVWDQRKGTSPIQYITAHLARIHGINWSHQSDLQLTTASQDGTIKYFDINHPRRAEKIITTSSPVWRARYTPFADGLVTIIVPHLGRGENSFLLWNNSKQNLPICSFVGHTDVILDFAFRHVNRNSDYTDMQLITWSRDQTLRVWSIDESVRKLCEKLQPDDDCIVLDDIPQNNMNNNNNNNNPTTKLKMNNRLSTDRLSLSCSLQHEFSLLNTNIPYVDVEVLDPNKRSAVFRITVNGLIIMLQMTFPLDYPSNDSSPEFMYCQGTTIDNILSESLLKVLKTCAYHRVRKGRTCLEQCLRAFVSALKKASGSDKSHLRLQSPRLEGALSGALHDACVPFPRTSSAKFCHVGILVTFCQPTNSKRISLRHQNTTPRALSALSGGYLGNVMGSQSVVYAHRDPDTSTFYLDRVKKSSKQRGLSSKNSVYTVIVYDVSKTLTVSKEMADNYLIDSSNISQMCHHNKLVAQQLGNEDVEKCWNLVEIISDSFTDLEANERFYQIPFAKFFLESLILHFATNYDIQMAAMLCYVFKQLYCISDNNSKSQRTSFSKSINQSPSGSPYNTILPIDTKTNPIWNVGTQLKQLRSNSWSDSLDDTRLLIYDFNRSLLDDSQKQLYSRIKSSYAEILFRWGLLVDRAKILKFSSGSIDLLNQQRGVEFVTECLKCTKVTPAAACKICHTPLLYCVLCRLPVRGAANACLNCGHGGHLEHMRKWFFSSSFATSPSAVPCATGCGCYCLEESSKLVHS